MVLTGRMCYAVWIMEGSPNSITTSVTPLALAELNNEEFSAAIQVRAVNYCYTKPAVPGVIWNCKG